MNPSDQATDEHALHLWHFHACFKIGIDFFHKL